MWKAAKMFNFGKKAPSDFISQLFDEKSFYSQFSSDLRSANQEVIIESPFITSDRMDKVLPLFHELVTKGVNVFIMTRSPGLHEGKWRFESEMQIQRLEEIGVQVLMTTNHHHRKLAIIDRQILWEGSLNILSHTESKEIMRRIEGEQVAHEMFRFLRLDRVI
jgi:phosphatidylserine/phosphatidylglycerophosphate/cardiolipin synthase-like enzyme